MPLGPFALISLFYLLLGVRVIYQLARSFRQTFDRNFTRQDRALVDQAAFFVLLPISVALHELGHAVAIWFFGGRVLDWGYYGFAGYVGYDPREFTQAEQIVVAAAGTVVNLLLAGIALALVFLKRPPLRAAVNELLIQFTWISLLNALIVYPVLDLLSGLNGDWTQMYGGGEPTLNLIILIIHVSVLGALFWAWRSPALRARLAQLTGEAPASARITPIGRRGAGASSPGESAVEKTLREAAARVASGWPAPVEAALRRGRDGAALVLSWGDGAPRRSVIAVAPDSGGLELAGAIQRDGELPEQRPLGRQTGLLDPDRLTLMLRLAMETVEGWGSPDETASRHHADGTSAPREDVGATQASPEAPWVSGRES